MHEFAFYWPLLVCSASQEHLVIDDGVLIHRISSILRLKVNEFITVFNRSCYAHVQIMVITKKTITFKVHSWHNIEPRKVTLTFLLPLLKRNDCQDAIYNLTEIGVDIIQLVITKQMHKSWWRDRADLERLERIAIAAAEQSKNFLIPTINPPVDLADFIGSAQNRQQLRCFFDPEGQSLHSLWAVQGQQVISHILALIGPEADLSTAEKKAIMQAGFHFYALTPTVLRACQAATIASGILRSLFSTL